MRILSCFAGHDSNVTLMEDGAIVAVHEKERSSRIKHDQGMLDLEPILKQHGWTSDSIDIIVANPYVRPDRNGRQADFGFEGPRYDRHNAYLAPGWTGSPEGRFNEGTMPFNGQIKRAFIVDHHLAHVAGAYYTSLFDECAVLSSDGGGDERFQALADCAGGKIKSIEYDWGINSAFPGSQFNIGSLWAAVGGLFGYERLEGAGKLMSLAAYSPEVAPEIKTNLMQAALYWWPAGYPLWLHHRAPPLDPHDQFSQMLARGLQELTTEAYLGAAERAWKQYDRKNLCLTGGVSMNCVANTAVHTSGLFDDTFVPFAPHDGGLSLGQALFVWHHVLGNPREHGIEPFLGMYEPLNAGVSTRVIVDLLEAGKTVGVCMGRSEVGPRALGARSILFDPRNPEVRDRLNQKIKHREWFRPFAPMVLESTWDDYFEQCVPSTYMGYVAKLKDSKQFPGITHVDGTTRPQIVEDCTLGLMGAILRMWHECTGCGLLGNTSFNSQEPLVDTGAQARATWKRTGLDAVLTSEGLDVKPEREVNLVGQPRKTLVCFDAIDTFSEPYLDALRGAGWECQKFNELNQISLQQANQADVVWCEWANELAAAVTQQLAPGPRVIVRLHAYEIHDQCLAASVNWQRVSALVTVSRPYGELVEARLGDLKHLKHVAIATGVDMEAIEYHNKAEAADDVRNTILWLGSLNFKKGANLLPLVAAALPDHRILVAGEMQDDRIALLLENPPANLKYLGAMPHAERNEFLAQGAYILNCSLRESFGVAIGEGMMAGCKPLIYRWPGAEDIWPREHTWGSFHELGVLLKEDFMSARYRQHVEQYALADMTALFVETVEGMVKDPA